MKNKCRTYKCKAACCYNVPFVTGFVQHNSEKVVNMVLNYTPLPGNHEMPITGLGMKNNKCPFLRSDLNCNIYDSRPEICRLMGTVPELPCNMIKG